MDTLLRLIYQNFLLSNDFFDIAKFMLRIVLASFLKDAVFAVFSPEKLNAPVPTRLISMVEAETLDQVCLYHNDKSSLASILNLTATFTKKALLNGA